MSQNNRFKLVIKLIIFFVIANLVGFIMIYSSFSDWQLQKTLFKNGIPTEATIYSCRQSRPTSCWMDYGYQAFSPTGEVQYYEVTHVTSCVYCENLLTTTVRYLPENPQIVAIEGERNIMFVFGLLIIVVIWIVVIGNINAIKKSKYIF